MNKIIVQLHHPTATWTTNREVDDVIEHLLLDEYGEEFLFEFDVWWRESCLTYSVYDYPEPLSGWNAETKTRGSVWESKYDLKEFVNYFFNHDYMNKFFLTLKNNGWIVTGPVEILV